MKELKVKETQKNNMKRFSEQFKKKSETLRLSVSEKRELRERVVSYMEYHPLPVKDTNFNNESAGDAVIEFNFAQFKSWPSWRILKTAGALVVVLAVGVSFWAEKAVPGDTLYAVKVGFNEEMRSTLARGSYEKVVWETQRLNRRIAEARQLADEGRLTVEVEVEVADAVRVHSENARKEIENLKLTDKDEATMASIELETALDVQTTSLKNRDDSGLVGQSTALIQTVLGQSQAIGLSSAEDDTLPALDKLVAKVESETTRAYELLEGVKKTATAEERRDIKRRLDDIERKITKSKAYSEEDNSLSSRQSLVEVLQQTHRLIVFMTNIDVRESVTVEEIVPVTLTLEERIDIVKKQTSETTTLIEMVDEKLNATSSDLIDKDVLAKVEVGFEQSSSSLAKTLDLIVVEPLDIETVEGYSLDAYNLIFDTAALLNIRNSIPETELDDIEEESGTSTEEVLPKDGEVSTSTKATTTAVELDV